MKLTSLGGKYAGVSTKELKNETTSFYITYKENGVSKRVMVGKSPEMTKTKALNILNAKKLELRTSGSIPKSEIEPKTKDKGNKLYTLNDLADIYFSQKQYSTLREVKIKYDYHVRNESFAQKPIQFITKEEVLNFLAFKKNQRADKRRAISKYSIEIKEQEEYESNLILIKRMKDCLESKPEDWILANKLQYLTKRNDILFKRINEIERTKVLNNKSIGQDEKNMILGLLSRKTIREIFFSCSSILNFAKEYFNIPYDSTLFKCDIKVENERDRYMTAEEINSYFLEIKRISREQPKHKNIYLISLLALSTAARQNTVLSIKIGDIDLENNIIKLKNFKKERSFSYKISTEKEREEIIKIIDNRPPEEYLFINYTKENPYRYPRIMKEVLNYTVNYKKNFTDWLTLKEFRNTTASHLAIKGTPLPHISQVLDHKNLNATKRYARLQPHIADKDINDFISSSVFMNENE